jgi:hypothetical protein
MCHRVAMTETDERPADLLLVVVGMTSSDAGNRDVTRQLHQVKSRLGASGRTQAAIDLHLNGMRFRVRVMRRDIECPVEAHEVEPITVSPGR